MEEIDIRELEEPKEIIEIIKMQLSMILTNVYHELEDYLLEFENIDDTFQLDIIKRMTMLKLLEEVEEIKHDLFIETLETYNRLIGEINLFKSRYKQENNESKKMIEIVNSSMKRTTIISIGVSVLAPSLIPLVLVIDIPKLVLDSIVKKYHRDNIDINLLTRDLYDTVQRPLYDLVCNLRSDYHKSKVEFKELEEKAIDGENIIEDLMILSNPERVGLMHITFDQELYDNNIKQLTLEKE